MKTGDKIQLTVDVTQDDLTKGVQCGASRCALALALERAVRNYGLRSARCSVGVGHAHFLDVKTGDFYEMQPLPHYVDAYTQAFDSPLSFGQPLPASFELEFTFKKGELRV